MATYPHCTLQQITLENKLINRKHKNARLKKEKDTPAMIASEAAEEEKIVKRDHGPTDL